MRSVNARRARMTRSPRDVIEGADVLLRCVTGDRTVGPVSNGQHVHLALNAHKNMTEGTIVEASYGDGIIAFWPAIVTEVLGYYVRLKWLGDESGDTFLRNFGSYDPPPEGQPDDRIFYVGYAIKEQKVFRAPPHLPVPEVGWPAFIKLHLLHANVLVENIHDKARKENESPLAIGSYVEADDITNIMAVRPAIVGENKGGRLRLSYVDGNSNQDFGSQIWLHWSSPRILPRGMARILGRKVTSTKSYYSNSLHEWTKESFEPCITNFKPRLVPTSLEKALKTHRFEIGAKLEVLDPLLPGKICVGTVVKVLENFWLEIRIEGAKLENGEDHIVCYHASDYELLPAGWASKNELGDYFAPPNNFSWKKETSIVPRELLEKYSPWNEPTHGFRCKQLYEAVGVAGTDLIYIIEVMAVKEPLVLIHFLGYGAEEDAFMPITSLDIFPLGWCESVRHPLQAPPV